MPSAVFLAYFCKSTEMFQKKAVILQHDNNKTIHDFEFGITGKCK